MKPSRSWQWMLLLLLSVLLLWIYARPHNDIMSGQDGPAYLHCASEYARHGKLSYPDEMLSKVSPEVREDFLYRGHKSSYLTKFGSLLLPDIKNDKTQTWFQIAPSLLLSVPAKSFGNQSILYVMPLFGLLNGLAIAVLAMTVLGKSRYIGWSVALLYWFNPLIIWHARALRPEFAASFLLWSGVALLFGSMQSNKNGAGMPSSLTASISERDSFPVTNIIRWLLASLALNMAPFFHVTATMVVLPMSIVVAWHVAKGNRMGLVFGAVQSLMVALFALQVTQFADPYHLCRYLQIGFGDADWMIWGVAGIAGWGIVGGIGLLVAKRLPDIGRHLKSSRVLRMLSAIILITLVTAILWHVHQTPPDEMKSFVYHYFYRTDLRAVARLVSLPIALSGFAGLLLILIRGGRGTSRRYAFCLIAMPAALGIGNMYDFFTTRYLIVAMIPLLTLSLVALIQGLNNFLQNEPLAKLLRRVGTPAPVSQKMELACPHARIRITVILVMLLAFLLHGRLLLIRHVDRAGLYEHLEEVADVINSDNAILLCEYSRVAGALEHLFDVPTLGIDGVKFESYCDIEKSWRNVMQKYPKRAAYYLTPFDSLPRSSRMNFEFVKKFRLESSVLVDRRWDLPVETQSWGLSLYLYKIHIQDDIIEDYRISMSPANMGFSRFSGCRNKSGVSVSGVNIPKNNSLTLSSCAVENMSKAELWLILHNTNCVPVPLSGSETSQLYIIPPVGRDLLNTKPQPLGNNWSLLRIPASELKNKPEIWTEDDTIVSQAFYIDDKGVVSADDILAKYPQTQHQLKPFVARWARQNASITLPRSGENGAVLMMFMTPPSEVGDSVVATMTYDGRRTTKNMSTGSWRWSAIPVASESPAGEIQFQTTHPFDPQVSGFDKDLCLFMGYGYFMLTTF